MIRTLLCGLLAAMPAASVWAVECEDFSGAWIGECVREGVKIPAAIEIRQNRCATLSLDTRFFRLGAEWTDAVDFPEYSQVTRYQAVQDESGWLLLVQWSGRSKSEDVAYQGNESYRIWREEGALKSVHKFEETVTGQRPSFFKEACLFSRLP